MGRRITVRLDDDLYQELENLSKSELVDISEIVRAAIKLALLNRDVLLRYLHTTKEVQGKSCEECVFFRRYYNMCYCTLRQESLDDLKPCPYFTPKSTNTGQ